MKKDRLLRLARELEKDAKRKRGIKFDLRTVIRPAQGGEPSLDCGTAACAIGLWALCGKFPGVKVVNWGGNIFGPQYRGRIGRDAAELYFGITTEESAWLFLASYYDDAITRGAKGEMKVAKRIRSFVSGREKPPQHAVD